jgi:hypothetical protein
MRVGHDQEAAGYHDDPGPTREGAPGSPFRAASATFALKVAVFTNADVGAGVALRRDQLGPRPRVGSCKRDRRMSVRQGDPLWRALPAT